MEIFKFCRSRDILENCKMLDLKILQKDITAAVTMLFAKVEDRR